METRIDHLRESVEKHDEADEKRFDKIDRGLSAIGWRLGLLVGAASLLGPTALIIIDFLRH